MHVIERLHALTTRDLIMTRFLRPHRVSPLRSLSFSFYLFRHVYLWSVYRQCTSQRKVEFKVNVISVDFVDCLSIVMMHNNIKLSLINNYRSCNCCESYMKLQLYASLRSSVSISCAVLSQVTMSLRGLKFRQNIRALCSS